MTLFAIIMLGLVVLGTIFLFRGLIIVGQSEVMVIERLGSYNRTLDHGINFIIPFIEKPVTVTRREYQSLDGNQVPVVKHIERIDLREMVLDFPGQQVVTSDNASISIDGVLYYHIVDAASAAYKVENLVQAIEVLAKTNLRSVVGSMELDKVFSSREDINNALQRSLDEASNSWGVKVTRTEVQNIETPKEIEDAMHKQMAAERERRAAVTKAEGEQKSQILIAEGERDATIARAEGEKQAITTVMEAGELTKEQTVAYLIGNRFIEQLPNIAKDGERVFIPLESSALMGSVGGFDELMKGLNMKSAG